MAAEITLFEGIASAQNGEPQVARNPFASKNATFTPDRPCLARILAKGGDVAVTLGSVTWTVVDGSWEYYWLDANKELGIA
ncbi:hypothetical protein AEAC466_17420 [Asticcacaulis sp. AC466]|uniref:hypothetical protein n=1 Tax=Asticcacaulis sp. AC466 TaxID=1282362 RepID=UPI0003C3DA2D|nr:hypothetical protein [Asticcacaulis sp. AC466]ESQ82403.1 hypothetical protein AEAC466_17420 [Asticcacaulis sp. AC466]